jgi:hypothetical protein
VCVRKRERFRTRERLSRSFVRENKCRRIPGKYCQQPSPHIGWVKRGLQETCKNQIFPHPSKKSAKLFQTFDTRHIRSFIFKFTNTKSFLSLTIPSLVLHYQVLKNGLCQSKNLHRRIYTTHITHIKLNFLVTQIKGIPPSPILKCSAKLIKGTTCEKILTRQIF